ncbi:MAG: RluA family pseudouridine synthase [Piscirickettsiaceae bacterium]|nr:RluA family pseudouridine synthase [Piscirickettsiaceae bacterium]
MISKPPTHHHVQFVNVTEDQAGQRIDNFLCALKKGVPKSRMYRAIRKGEIRIDKRRISQEYRIKADDNIRIPPLNISNKIYLNTVSKLLIQQLNKSIIFEDDNLLVLDKPAGLAVHAGSDIPQGVIEALRIIRNELHYLELVHRLDRGTSGCLLIAKNRKTLINLQQQLIENDVNKHYLTLLRGGWTGHNISIEQPLISNITSLGQRIVKVDTRGKYAKTVFMPRQRFPQAQLTEALLHTGRTHQLRVHAAYIDHPVAGDYKYGQHSANKNMEKFGLKRLFLHAWKVRIKYPDTNHRIMLKAPLPTTLKNVLNELENKHNF